MARYTKEDIFRIVEEEDVAFIRLQFCDIFGIPKNIAIAASKLESALNNECMFDGVSVEGFMRSDESDMYLYPDLDSFEIYPWRPQSGKVARMFCNVYMKPASSLGMPVKCGGRRCSRMAAISIAPVHHRCSMFRSRSMVSMAIYVKKAKSQNLLSVMAARSVPSKRWVLSRWA